MNLRILLVCLIAISIAGCQLLPMTDGGSKASYHQGCFDEIPDLSQNSCLLDDWIAFGLASQQGDSKWRDEMREKVDAEQVDQRLAQAILLAWGNESEQSQASSLLRADLAMAPPRLQTLLSYWLNELEQRREITARLAEARSTRHVLNAQKRTLNTKLEALDRKLEALTDIERNINARQLAD